MTFPYSKRSSIRNLPTALNSSSLSVVSMSINSRIRRGISLHNLLDLFDEGIAVALLNNHGVFHNEFATVVLDRFFGAGKDAVKFLLIFRLHLLDGGCDQREHI